MFRKSYFYMVVVFVIVGIVSMFVGFSSVTKGMRDRWTAVTSPDYECVVYLDLGTNYIDNIDGNRYYSGRNSFKVKRLVDVTQIDHPVICDDVSKFDDYRAMFKNEETFANMTVTSMMKRDNINRRGEYVSLISEYQSYDTAKYRECDLGIILSGYLQGKTWSDIGYNSTDEIVIVLPSKDSKYYDYVIAQLFVALDNDNILTEHDMNREASDVKWIVDHALTYYSTMSFENNYIFIGCEQGSIFKELQTRSKMESVYFTRSVYPSVKIFYNDEPIEGFVAEQTKGTNNILGKYCGYRFVENEKYAGCAMDNGSKYWNKSAPNIINRCTIEYWPFITDF